MRLATVSTSVDLADFDPFADEVQQHPHAYYAAMRAEAPVLALPADSLGRPGETIYAVSTYPLVEAVLGDWATFSSRFGTPGGTPPSHLVPELKAIAADGYPNPATMLTADPPDHTRYRRLVARAFSVRRVQGYEPTIRAICEELVDAWSGATRVDLISQFAVPIPTRTVAFALGVEQDRWGDFKRWADQSVAPIGRRLGDDAWRDSARAVVEQQRYFAGQLEARRQAPRDDLLTALVQARTEPDDGGEGQPLTDAELLSVIRQLAVAGSETTTSLIADLMVLLDEHPDEWRRLQQEPARIPLVVEEALRLASPNQGLFRIATRDTELGGVSIPKGAAVWVMFGSANRDETVFADPDRFDPDRENLSRHVAFGKGVHFCLGAGLARLEANVALDVLTQRLDRFAVVDRDALRYAPSFVLRGLERLDLEVAYRG
jgi:cytochrome P450